MSIKSFKRLEKKFILTSPQYENLISILNSYMIPDKYCKDGKTYGIYNIYYDNENNDVIRHSISKPYYKEKLRLRSYNEFSSPDDIVFLELKKKMKKIVNKRRLTLKLKEAYDFLENGKEPDLKEYIDKQVINEIKYYLSKNPVKPSVYIGYTRNALFGKDDPEFRITFDSKIISRRTNLLLESGCFGDYILDEDNYLMEVKFLGSIPLWFTKILSELEIYNTHFSKYGNDYINYCSNNNLRRKNIC